MNFERIELAKLHLNRRRHPMWNLGEAIRREAFFQQEIIGRGFNTRELYMLADVGFRPDQTMDIINAVDKMLDRRGLEK